MENEKVIRFIFEGVCLKKILNISLIPFCNSVVTVFVEFPAAELFFWVILVMVSELFELFWLFNDLFLLRTPYIRAKFIVPFLLLPLSLNNQKGKDPNLSLIALTQINKLTPKPQSPCLKVSPILMQLMLSLKGIPDFLFNVMISKVKEILKILHRGLQLFIAKVLDLIALRNVKERLSLCVEDLLRMLHLFAEGLESLIEAK